MFWPGLIKLHGTLPLAVKHIFAASWMSAHARQACAYYSAASSRWINTCWKYYKQDICMWPKSFSSAPPCKHVGPLFNEPGSEHLLWTKYVPIFNLLHKYAHWWLIHREYYMYCHDNNGFFKYVCFFLCFSDILNSVHLWFHCGWKKHTVSYLSWYIWLLLVVKALYGYSYCHGRKYWHFLNCFVK